MTQFTESYHRKMFLTARILTGILTLFWIGLILFAIYQFRTLSQQLGISLSAMIRNVQTPFIVMGFICLAHILLWIYLQQRKKWAVATMFVLAALEFAASIMYFVAAIYENAPFIYYLIITAFFIPLGVLLWSLSESYKAINHEKILSQVGFAPVMKDEPAPIKAMPVETVEDK